MRNIKMQLLRGFEYHVTASETDKTYQIVNLETGEKSAVLDDMEHYFELKKAYRKGRKTLDDMCKQAVKQEEFGR
jgi:hypothetical protein